MITDLSNARVGDSVTPSPVVTPRTTVATALRLLREHCLPVLPVSDGDRLAGTVSLTDLLRLTPSEATTLDVYELHGVLGRLTVARIVRPSGGVRTDASLAEAAAQMVREGAEALPVIEDGHFVGLLVWTAIVSAALGAQRVA